MKKKKIKSLLSGEKYKFRKMKNYSNELKRENERIQSNLNFLSKKHQELADKTKVLISENERLTSKNKVLVQSIENLIKEAKILLQSNDNPSKDDFHEAENQATFFDGGEWVPKVGDEVEITGAHFFRKGSIVRITEVENEQGHFKLNGISSIRSQFKKHELKEWIPQIGDEVEIISNEYNTHFFDVGEKGHVVSLLDNRGYFIIKVETNEQYLLREDFKKA